MRTEIAKVISGGQTGADRGGLDAAIEVGIPHGGWCPKGRRAEDGRIPDEYRLVETDSSDYAVRTEQNVVDSHATVVLAYGLPAGGSKATVEIAKKYRRPWLHVDLNETGDEAIARRVLEWLSGGGLQSPDIPVPPLNPALNVAGSRESKAPGIQARVKAIMLLVLDWPGYTPHAE